MREVGGEKRGGEKDSLRSTTRWGAELEMLRGDAARMKPAVGQFWLRVSRLDTFPWEGDGEKKEREKEKGL